MGEENVGSWHVYANPFELEIYPVLAMEGYIFHSRRLLNQTLHYSREKSVQVVFTSSLIP